MKKEITSLLTILLILIASFFNNLIAQDTTMLTSGMLIRISAPTVFEKRITGIILSSKTDTLLILPREKANSVVIPLASVNRLEVSRAEKETLRPALFALLGYLGGGLVGTFITGLTEEDADPGGFVTFVMGGGTGAFIGYQIGNDLDKKWETVPLSQLRIGRGP